MFRRLFATTAVVLIATIAAAQAGDSIVLKGPSARPNSVSYVGYDSFDANGNPICTPCLEQKAKEAAKLQAYLERRERSRQYMARLQGNGPKPDTLGTTATTATMPPASAPLTAQTADVPEATAPAAANGLLAVGDTPLRAAIQ